VSREPRDSRHRISQVGRYTIFGQIAAGGAVMLHLARFSGPAGFSRIVAVKRLHPRLAEDPELRTAFLCEARQISNVRHRNVVPTLDVVVNETEVLQVLEHIQGATLGTLRNSALRQQQDIPLSVCAAVMVGALHGLHAAHEARGELGEPLEIVHAGVTPAHILVGIDGVPMMIGFGDARAVRGRTDVNPSVPGEPTYLAPEQIRGERLTRATDIFSAAVVLWELLAARWLFGGVAEHERRYRLLQGGDLTPPSTIAARLPRGLDDVVMKGLRADPAERYRTALEMAAAIEHAIPCASQPMVGEWVTRTAADALAQQTEMLKDIEVSSRSGALPIQPEELDDGMPPRQIVLGIDPPSDIEHTIAPRIVARPPAAPGRDLRALAIGTSGAIVFAGLLALSHQAMRAGVFRPTPPPPALVPSGAAPMPIGTTVIMSNDPGAPVATAAAGEGTSAVVAATDGGASAVGAPVLPPPSTPDPGPVLSRDTTLDPKAAEAAARALLRDRRPPRRAASGGAGGAGAKAHRKGANAESPASETNEDSAAEPEPDAN
jgi:serine/threonine protein kinase